MTKIILTYTPMAKAISDFDVEGWYQTKLHLSKQHHTIALMTANQLVVTRFRVGLVEGDFDALILAFSGEEYQEFPVEADGHVDWWNIVPDFQMDLHMRLI